MRLFIFLLQLFVVGIVWMAHLSKVSGHSTRNITSEIHKPRKMPYMSLTHASAAAFMDEYMESHFLPENTRFQGVSAGSGHRPSTAGVKKKQSSSSGSSRSSRSSSSKDKELLLFVGVTTNMHNVALRRTARQTWLLPCIADPRCDYRFFCDAAVNITEQVRDESKLYDDMVFRESCALMKRHPVGVNYGNSPPSYKPIRANSPAVYAPDYAWRRMYKVDWKVCFAKWALDHGRMAAYHAWVEDDSFVCMENLLFQMRKLEQLPGSDKLAFRTGTPLFNGFDDSSTLMSRPVAKAFAEHWTEPGLDCPEISHLSLEQQQTGGNGTFNWLSWGNSWRSEMCNWRERLKQHLNMDLVIPFLGCFNLENGYTKWRRGADGVPVSPYKFVHGKGVHFPCKIESMIRHHAHITVVVLNEPRSRHICETSIFLDKVKEPREMEVLWRVADKTNFTDYSVVFSHHHGLGWDMLIENYNYTRN